MCMRGWRFSDLKFLESVYLLLKYDKVTVIISQNILKERNA